MVKKQIIKKDDFFEKEAQKYAFPVPSRSFILDYLQKRAKPASLEALIDGFELTAEEEIEGLRRRLLAMTRDGQLLNNRRGDYALVKRLALVRGRVSGHRDGYGFVIPDEDGDDIYLNTKEMLGVFHGDRVLVSVNTAPNGRQEGSLVEVLEHNTQTLVGRYFSQGNINYVVPDSKHIVQDIIIPQDNSLNVEQGQIVLIEITQQPHKRRQAVGKVLDVLGEAQTPGIEIDMMIHNHHLPHKWPEDVLETLGTFSLEITDEDLIDREDLRDLNFVTIDGEDAKDFDDAVYCQAAKSGGWKLWVAIADVAHYVKMGEALDKEALHRGNSVYFPGRVIPMLPEVLSNELCSLKPKVDRLSLVCEMRIDEEGNITRSRFYNAVIHSKARMTYTNVAKIISGEHKTLRKQYAEIAPHLDDLYALYKILLKARVERGAIEFETIETRIIFGRDRKIESIVPVVRNDAHRLIEECMLAANVCTARFLLRHKIPSLYRIHHGPSVEKLTNLRQFLSELGLHLKGGDDPTPADYSRLITEIQTRPDSRLIQTVLLRSLSQATYTPDNVGHFGLAYSEYTHFTSPIRRYPDLLTHRAIKHILTKQPISQFPYSAARMAEMGVQCSTTERNADDATREAVDWLKCEYMQDKVGQIFPGIISSVTHFGLFVTLDNIYVDGLLHVSQLASDYYQFDAAKHRMLGERTGKTYRIGDPIEVLIAKVNLDERLIDFVLADTPLTTKKPKSNQKPKPPKSVKKTTSKQAKK